MADYNGTTGDNRYEGTSDDDIISGNAGNDDLDGKAGDDAVAGDAGDDFLKGGEGDDALSGGAGNDTIFLSPGHDTIDGGEGTDWYNLSGWVLTDGVSNASAANLVFAQVDLRVEGLPQRVGYDSNLTPILATLSSIENVAGSRWSDEVVGNDAANHFLDINDGNDDFAGGGGDDVIEIRRGVLADVTTSASSRSRILAGEGNDAIDFLGRARLVDSINVRGDGGDDTVRVENARNAAVAGGEGADLISVINARSSTTDGGSGNDRLLLSVTSGKHAVTLGAGADILTVGRLGTAAITVKDFVAGDGGDTLSFWTILRSNALRNYVPLELLDRFDWNNPFASGHLRLLQVGEDTHVQFDRDGGGDAFQDLLILEGIDVSDLTYRNLDGFSSGVRTTSVNGTDRNDTLHGTGESDKIYGLSGNDTLTSLTTAGSNDVPVMLSGADSLHGGAGDDTYYVDSRYDRVIEAANEGIDTVYAGDNFVLSGNVENLTLRSNRASSGTGNEGANHIDGNAVANSLRGMGGNDFIDGNDGNDLLEGNAGNDELTGDDGDDLLKGGTGNDFLSGGDGNDRLDGGKGRDVLLIERGLDVLQGGAGADRFVLYSPSETTADRALASRIVDFNQREGDRIDLSVFGSEATGQVHFNFIGSAAFGKVAGELHAVIDSGNTYVEGDADGDGLADFAIRLDGVVALTAADFVL